MDLDEPARFIELREYIQIVSIQLPKSIISKKIIKVAQIIIWKDGQENTQLNWASNISGQYQSNWIQMKSILDYYLAGSQEYVQASYAPTGRAKCKGCKDTISEGYLRIGQILDDDHFNAKKWYHWDCYKLKPRFKVINPEKQIWDLQNLKKKDQNIILKHIKAEVNRINGGKKSNIKDEKSRKSQSKSQRSKSSKTVQKVEKGGKGKSKGKGKSQPKTEEIKVQPRRGRSKSVAKSVSDQPQSKPVEVKPKKVKKLKKLKKSFMGYTEEQYEKYKEYFNEYMGKTADVLKGILAANGQSRSGNKTDLADKCADGKVLGRIPQCESCGGGRLRFDMKTGIYKCPGYMEDDDFVNCNKVYMMDQVQRAEWIEP